MDVLFELLIWKDEAVGKYVVVLTLEVTRTTIFV